MLLHRERGPASPSQGPYVGSLEAEPGCSLAYLLGDVALTQMAVVLLDHPRVAMSQSLGDYKQGDAVHSAQARPCVAELMEADRRLDLSALTCGLHRIALVSLLPLA